MDILRKERMATVRDDLREKKDIRIIGCSQSGSRRIFAGEHTQGGIRAEETIEVP